MQPVVTVEEMAAIDAAAQRETPIEVLIGRAGAAVARRAVALMGGTYGRRVTVVAGKGHNGDDGRVAAQLLSERGVRVEVVDAAVPKCWTGRMFDEVDLVVDAAFGTGFRGSYDAPDSAAPVLAVDIPSGVNGDTGEAAEGAVRADACVTFAAWKPGLLFGRGAELAGPVEVVDVGLDCSAARAALVGPEDVVERVPRRPRESHKWESAVGVIAGGPGMMGAPVLCSDGALRAGSGMVRLGIPGTSAAELPAGETVTRGLPSGDWSSAALGWTERCHALVVGPGLGREADTQAAVRRVVAEASVPVVVDADGLHALGTDGAGVLRGRRVPTILTPHDGEFAALTGAPPGADRMAAARGLAETTGAVVLLKGPTTVVAGPDGRALLSTSGTPGLATAGTGDVLSGVVAALLAEGVEAEWAGALGAYVHGLAARRGPSVGLMAGDLPDLVSGVLSDLVGAG